MENLAVSDANGNTKQRALLVLGILVYIACFQWVYVHWVQPVFGYLGYDYNPPSTGYMLLAWTLSALPSLWMPVSLIRPSQLMYWVLYLTVFIPSMFIPLFARINPPFEIAGLMFTLFIGFAITGLSYRRPLLKLQPSRLSASRFWYGFAVVGGGLAVWALAAFWGNLHIVSFMDIYDVRNAADDVMAGTLLYYPLMLLPGAINPFLMAWGLYHKKPWIFVTGALGQVLVYSIMGTKGSATSVLFIPAIYFLLRGDRSRFAIKLTWSVVALFIILGLFSQFTGDTPGGLVWTVLFVVFLRVFGADGLSTAHYYDFFQHNPLTHLANLKGFNLLMHYPYSNPLGVVVGSYYTGDPTFDETAHFWAMDGLAGFGLLGILLASALCAFIFWMLDSVAREHDIRLSTLVISYAAYNFANGSLFTTLLSGGLGLLMVVFYLMPREAPEVFHEPVISGAMAPLG